MRSMSPVAVAVFVLAVASCFVLARWVVAADQDVSRFIVAGSTSTSQEVDVAVSPGPGYDGQFAYRLALDPSDLSLTAGGVSLDRPLRLQRIAYPSLAWLLSLSQDDLVPATLVLVNLGALALLALLAAQLARAQGRSAMTGLLVVAFPGFVLSLSRDLTEIVAALFLLAGILAWWRGRLFWSAVATCGAVLTRESALLVVGTFLLTEVLMLVRRHHTVPWRHVAAASAPLATFVGWQAVVTQAAGSPPVLSSTEANLVFPGQDLLPAAVRWGSGAVELQPQSFIDAGQFTVLAMVVVLAGLSLRTAAVPAGVVAAWLVSLLLVLSLSESVWRGPADFRTASDLHLMSTVLLLASARRLWLPAAALACATLPTMLLRVVTI